MGDCAISSTAIRTKPLSLDQISDTLEEILSRSPADETELVWLELRRSQARNRGRQVECHSRPERTVMLRVLDRGRVGSHRTGASDLSELETAVRMAMAQSRSREPLPGLPHIPADETPVAEMPDVYDSELAKLGSRKARSLIERLQPKRESVSLDWTDARVAVFNSRGVRRQVAVTSATFEASRSRRPGGGRAAGSSRTLKRLEPHRILERARERHASGSVEEPPEQPVAVVLSPEATIQLCDLLNRMALSAITYYRGSSFLRQHLDVQVFDRALNLRDDATDATGLAFPFDLEGTAKRPVDLILKGSPKTPALDQRQAAQLGLPPTAHAIGGNDARAENLFLLPGEARDEEVLQAADGGLWFGWLDHLESFEPTRAQILAHVQGVRRIENGKLGKSLPDVMWEDSLLRAFSSLLSLGRNPEVCALHDSFLGGISAPAVAIAGVGNLKIL